MLLSRYVVVAINGVNNMRTSWRTIEPKGIEDYLNDLCKVYRGEEDNPHDINATCEDERVIQILRYHLWDVEKSVMERPGYWRFLVIEHHGSLPGDDKSIASRIYEFAVKMKLDKLSEMGTNLKDVYRRISK